ncbi:MAG TPA: hypothetical protein VMD48_10505 [Solirubrobacteraceae bacterium]|nr:hypothetical protein [Solirubrobacteraceae bacterium]
MEASPPRFLESLFARDPSGAGWLPALLQAVPYGRAALGELADEPGWIEISLAVPGASGQLAAFDYPATPSRGLLAWFVDHPDALTWPDGAEHSPASARLRRALLDDDPSGARAKAQDRAHELMQTASAFASDWWRFEDASALDCVLMTDRLVLVIEADPLSPATDWYPQRTRLVRDLEAAKQLARGRAFAMLVLGGEAAPEGDQTVQLVAAGAPHLTGPEREELAAGYLGGLTWEQAREAVA